MIDTYHNISTVRTVRLQYGTIISIHKIHHTSRSATSKDNTDRNQQVG